MKLHYRTDIPKALQLLVVPILHILGVAEGDSAELVGEESVSVLDDAFHCGALTGHGGPGHHDTARANEFVDILGEEFWFRWFRERHCEAAFLDEST